MQWTQTEYPPEMKYLPERVRKKAIRIANSLLKLTSMREGRAIHAAIGMARADASRQEKADDTGLKKRGSNARARWKHLFVISCDSGWAIRFERSGKAHEVFSTKRYAVQHARRMASLTGADLTILKKDGTVEKRLTYNPQSKRPSGIKSK